MKNALKFALKKTAHQRIVTLFEQAVERPRFAKRYVALARKMSSRYKVPIPMEWKRKFCKECNALLGGTVRIRGKMKVTSCACGAVRRLPLR